MREKDNISFISYAIDKNKLQMNQGSKRKRPNYTGVRGKHEFTTL